MEPVHFSEFSYGYALTSELVQSLGPNLKASPVFPSLQQEGMRGGGYDVQLKRPGIPLFLQFKLSDKMVRNYAPEAKAGLLHVPFYRMHLRPAARSNQHQLLLELETQGNEVYYVAPGFYETVDLDFAYSNGQVAEHSVFIKPSAIGALPNLLKHHIAFQQAPTPIAYFLSEPEGARNIKFLNSVSFAKTLEGAVRASGTKTLNESIKALAEEMLKIIREKIQLRLDGERTVLNPILGKQSELQQVAYVARTFFDCSLFIINEKQTE